MLLMKEFLLIHGVIVTPSVKATNGEKYLNKRLCY